MSRRIRNIFRLFESAKARDILRYNKAADQKILHQPSKPLDFPLNDTAHTIIAELYATRFVLDNFVGLAAPQIGYNQQISLIEVPEPVFHSEPTATSTFPLTLLINPSYQPIEEEGQSTTWECCYSIPDMAGEVTRYNAIECSYYDKNGEAVSMIAEGFLARLFQHEVDHLKGITYNHKLAPGGRLLTAEELIALMAEQQRSKPKL